MNNGDTKNNHKYIWKNAVSWKVFAWAMGVVLLLFGVVFTSMASINVKLDEHTKEYTKIQVQLSQIQTDISWVKSQLK